MTRFAAFHIPIIAIACTLAGCTQPAVAPKAPAFQESENTVRDWRTVAQQIATALTARGFLADPLAISPAPAELSRYPLFVQVTAPGSTFLHEVRNALEQEILHRGGTLSRSPANSIVVNLEVDVVQWGTHLRIPGGLATVAGLAAGTAILLNDAAPLSPAAGFGIAVGAGLVADAILALTPDTNTEAVWKVSVLSSDQVLMTASGPMYISASDIPLYESRTRLSPVVSLTAAVAPRPRQLGPRARAFCDRRVE